MLTPIDIQNRQLKTKMGGGYDRKETDDFLAEVIANYEELYKENQSLKEKIISLSEGIQYYKKMEGTLQKALVLAEKTSTETQEAARTQADSMMTEASVKAEALSRETKAEIDALRAEAQAQAEVTKAKANRELEETRNHVRKLVQSYENYRLQFKKLAEAQIEMLESESFSIFVPELDELMNEAPSADSVMDNPGIIPINIGSPAPFVDLPDEPEAEEPASSEASLVEELPVSISIPVSSTEPFTAPPADDIAPSIDLNVSSSILSEEKHNSSLAVDLGTGSINIPISTGAFVSPDDDIAEDNALPEQPASSAEIPAASAEQTAPSMEIPAAAVGPADGIMPSAESPVTTSAAMPAMGMQADGGVSPFLDLTAPSGSGMDLNAVNTMAVGADANMATNPQTGVGANAGASTPANAGVSPFMDIPMDTAQANAPAEAGVAANVSPFMDIPMEAAPEAAVPGTDMNVVNAMAEAMAGMPENTPVSAGSFTGAPAPAPAPANAGVSPFMDIPMDTAPDMNQPANPIPDMGAVNAMAGTMAGMPENTSVSAGTFTGAPAPAPANAGVSPFMDIPMDTAPDMNQPANPVPDMGAVNAMAGTMAGMPENTPVSAGAFTGAPAPAPAPANAGVSPFVDIPMGGTAPDMNQPANPVPDMGAVNAMTGAVPEMPAASADTIANPFMDIPTEAPANTSAFVTAETPMMDMAATNGLIDMTEPPAEANPAPADNNVLMGDPFMDVGSMFDSPITEIPAEAPAEEQAPPPVENFIDINPFNFIDPE